MIDPQPATEDAWMMAMRAGDFARAWEINDAVLRSRREQPRHCGPRHLQQIWTGESLAGKRVLVRCYHGLGDTLQFIRFVAPLRKIAREVIVWAQPELMQLVSTARGVDRVLPLHNGSPDVDYDIDIEVMELAHALRVTPDAISRDVPYLTASNLIQRDVFPTIERPRIGIVWAAGGWDERRSVTVKLVSQLAAMLPVSLYSLQRGTAQSEVAAIPAIDISAVDVSQAAAILQHLDLLITVDTMVAHLAGALAVPVFTMLHAACDWRWMAGEGYSLWYPTMRLFRQTRPGDWSDVIENVASATRAMCETTHCAAQAKA